MAPPTSTRASAGAGAGSGGNARGLQDLGARVKILLADDSVTMHRAVALGLKNEPFDVMTCDNGQDALRLCLENRPAIVLADLDMPGLTGIELCQAIRREPSLAQTKVVLLCGSFDQVDESRLNGVPADGRLWKPFESQALIALVHNLLKAPSGTRADPTGQLHPQSPQVREANSKTAALPSSPTALVSSPTAPKRSEASQSDIVRDLTEQTFREASTNEIKAPPSVVRESAAPTVPAIGNASQVQKLPHATKRNPARDPPAIEDEVANLPRMTPELAVKNLWSSDFEPEIMDSLGEPSKAMPTIQRSAYDSGPETGPGSDFEIVTSSLDLQAAEGLPLPQDSSFRFETQPLQPAQPMETERLGSPTSETLSGASRTRRHPPEETEQVQVEQRPPTLVPDAESWSSDMDFSSFQSETTVPPGSTGGGYRDPTQTAGGGIPVESPFPHPPGMIDESQAADELLDSSLESFDPSPSLTRGEIRSIVRDEVHEALKTWLRSALEEQLTRVMAEINRE